MVRIELTRQVEVRAYRFAGTVAMAEPRQELVAFLKAITELGGEIEAEDLVGYLVPEAFRAAAGRLLVIALAHGLVQRAEHGVRLTEAGELARDLHQVMVPRDGTWQAWLATDPLVPCPLVHVEAVHPADAFKELEATGGKGRPKSIDRADVPAELRSCLDLDVTTLAGKKRTVRICDAGASTAPQPLEAELRVEWMIGSTGKPRVRLTGSLPAHGQRGSLRIDEDLAEPQVEFESVLDALLDQAGVAAFWDSQAGVLRCDVDGLDAASIQSMRRSVAVRRLDLDGLGFGVFQSVSVPDIPLGADSPDAAQRWATRRLLAGIHEHQTASRFEHSLKRAAAPFEEFDPTLPSREVLLAALAPRPDESGRRAARTPTAWRLQAPADFRI